MVENKYASSVAAVVVAVEPVATTVASAWGLVLCPVSDVGNGRWNSETNLYLFDLIVLTFVIFEDLPR